MAVLISDKRLPNKEYSQRQRRTFWNDEKGQFIRKTKKSQMCMCLVTELQPIISIW